MIRLEHREDVPSDACLMRENSERAGPDHYLGGNVAHGAVDFDGGRPMIRARQETAASRRSVSRSAPGRAPGGRSNG
jgi:hypothetical protein